MSLRLFLGHKYSLPAIGLEHRGAGSPYGRADPGTGLRRRRAGQVAREIDRNLVRIRDLSIQTSAGAEQTQTASQELPRLAGDLSGLVRRFKV